MENKENLSFSNITEDAANRERIYVDGKEIPASTPVDVCEMDKIFGIEQISRQAAVQNVVNSCKDFKSKNLDKIYFLISVISRQGDDKLVLGSRDLIRTYNQSKTVYSVPLTVDIPRNEFNCFAQELWHQNNPTIDFLESIGLGEEATPVDNESSHVTLDVNIHLSRRELLVLDSLGYKFYKYYYDGQFDPKETIEDIYGCVIRW